MREEEALLLMFLLVATAMVTVLTLVLRHRRQVRELLSRERLAALEKGMEIPWEMELRRPRRSWRLHLKSGVVLCGAGLGIALAASIVGGEDARWVLAWGAVLLSIGGANVAYDVLVGRREWQRSAALDDSLVRAYIRKLEGVSAHEDAGADR